MGTVTPPDNKSRPWYLTALARLPLCGRRTGKITRWLLLAVFFLYPAYNYYNGEASAQVEWDFLLLTGIAALWFGLLVVASVDEEFNNMLSRLIERGVLPKDLDQSALAQLLDEKANLAAQGIALVATLAILIAFAVSLYYEPRLDKALLALPESIGAYIAGSYLGRMVSFGRLATHVAQAGWMIRIFPEHVDGVGGLKPVGDFYFRQAMITAIPVLFLGIWSVIFPHWTGRDYSDWADPYLGLLVVALVIMLAAFVAPMVKFHSLMVEKKREALLDADKLSRQVREERESNAPDAEITDIAGRIEVLRSRYWVIENMPVWPLHISTLKRFRRNYLVLTTPLITRLVDDNTKIGEQVANLLKALGGS